MAPGSGRKIWMLAFGVVLVAGLVPGLGSAHSKKHIVTGFGTGGGGASPGAFAFYVNTKSKTGYGAGRFGTTPIVLTLNCVSELYTSSGYHYLWASGKAGGKTYYLYTDKWPSESNINRVLLSKTKGSSPCGGKFDFTANSQAYNGLIIWRDAS